ncbi:hypothetical protein [uncultured Flavobacterium sp.]|jgi:hypothetical protein|uniref:hypothetical protein n=1 Tax=uncultured Flavobacterium sp. TaxID=165435 RepID=UPI0025CCBDBD|nr:hypothetical protein [uncultured Flavobacterium sp.]
MKKVSFDQKGLDEKKKELYALPEPEFRQQLKEIQNNTHKWLLANFELSEGQVDYLNAMPKEVLSELGLSTAIAIDYKLPLTLEVPTAAASGTARVRICKKTEATGQLHVDWSEGSSPEIKSWSVGVRFTL